MVDRTNGSSRWCAAESPPHCKGRGIPSPMHPTQHRTHTHTHQQMPLFTRRASGEVTTTYGQWQQQRMDSPIPFIHPSIMRCGSRDKAKIPRECKLVWQNRSCLRSMHSRTDHMHSSPPFLRSTARPDVEAGESPTRLDAAHRHNNKTRWDDADLL